jgi:hypothetical protein
MPTTQPGQDLLDDVRGIKSQLAELRIAVRDARGLAATASNEAKQAVKSASDAATKAELADGAAKRANQKAELADGKASRADSKADTATRRAATAEVEARTAKGKADTADFKASKADRDAAAALGESKNAKGKADTADFKASKADRDAAAAFGEAKKVGNVADEALSTAKVAKVTGETAENTAKGARRVAEIAKKGVDTVEAGLDKLGGLVRRVEGLAVDASYKALRALGLADDVAKRTLKISGELLSLTGKVLGIIDTIANMLTLIFALQALGGRIDAVEQGIEFVSRSVSDILGRWIPTIRGIANQAKSTAEKAINYADAAGSIAARSMAVAREATYSAKTAQSTANVAGQEAAAANNNALRAGQNALTAYIAARTALGLYQSLRNRPGVPGKTGPQGKPGIPGKNGLRGLPGLQGKQGVPGIPGKDGKRGVQGIPGPRGERGFQGWGLQGNAGSPGRDGRDGLPGLPGRTGRDGLPGKDGKDVNPADLAEIRARLIAIQGQNTTTHQKVDSGFVKVLSNIKNLFLLPIINATTTAINTTLGSPIIEGGNKIGLTAYTVNSFTRTFKFFKWAVFDRFLNLMIFASTVHNAVQLSNDIGQTLLGAFSNVLQLFGINDSDGNAYNLSDLINKSFEEIVKGLVGSDNYTNLTTAWAKANRIYQASTNILNSFQNLTSTVLNALEITAGRIGKIGNALRKSGEVLDNAYTWMNPQPKFNRVTNFLEGLQNGASTIQMVTQAPLDVINATTEMTNASTEFVKALGEDDKPENKGNNDNEPQQLKADLVASKLASLGQEMTEADLEPDEDVN